jgi:hypothetical protein
MSEEAIEEERVADLKIWKVPRAVAMAFFSYARENAGNKGWLALKLLLEKQRMPLENDSLAQRVESLEAAVQELQAAAQKEEPKKEDARTVRVFGPGEKIGGLDGKV